MYFLVENDRIVGTVQDPSSFPDRQLLPTEGLDAADAYYDPDSGGVKPKGATPSDRHFWDPATLQWQEPPSVEMPSVELPDWTALLDYLEESPAGIKAFQAAKLTSGANAVWTAIQTVLTKTQKPDRLALLLVDLLGEIEALVAQGYLTPYTDDEKSAFRAKLAQLHFPNAVQEALL